MNRFTTTGLLAFTLTLTVVMPAANAQQGGDATTQTQEQHGRHHHGSHDPHKTALRLSKKLGLTSDQTAKLEPILAERQQKMEALRADSSTTEPQKKEQMRAIRQSTQQQMAAVLTPEQMEQLKAMHKGHGHHGAGPAGA